MPKYRPSRNRIVSGSKEESTARKILKVVAVSIIGGFAINLLVIHLAFNYSPQSYSYFVPYVVTTTMTTTITAVYPPPSAVFVNGSVKVVEWRTTYAYGIKFKSLSNGQTYIAKFSKGIFNLTLPNQATYQAILIWNYTSPSPIPGVGNQNPDTTICDTFTLNVGYPTPKVIMDFAC